MTQLRLKVFRTSGAGLGSIAKRFQTSRKYVNPRSGCVGAVDGIYVKIRELEPQEEPCYVLLWEWLLYDLGSSSCVI